MQQRSVAVYATTALVSLGVLASPAAARVTGYVDNDYESRSNEGYRVLHLINEDGSGDTAVARFDQAWAAASPDGKYVAVASSAYSSRRAKTLSTAKQPKIKLIDVTAGAAAASTKVLKSYSSNVRVDLGDYGSSAVWAADSSAFAIHRGVVKNKKRFVERIVCKVATGSCKSSLRRMVERIHMVPTVVAVGKNSFAEFKSLKSSSPKWIKCGQTVSVADPSVRVNGAPGGIVLRDSSNYYSYGTYDSVETPLPPVVVESSVTTTTASSRAISDGGEFTPGVRTGYAIAAFSQGNLYLDNSGSKVDYRVSECKAGKAKVKTTLDGGEPRARFVDPSGKVTGLGLPSDFPTGASFTSVTNDDGSATVIAMTSKRTLSSVRICNAKRREIRTSVADYCGRYIEGSRKTVGKYQVSAWRFDPASKTFTRYPELSQLEQNILASHGSVDPLSGTALSVASNSYEAEVYRIDLVAEGLPKVIAIGLGY